MAALPVAVSIIPDRFADGRNRIIEQGAQAAGFQLHRGFAKPTSPADILLTWTVHRGDRGNAAQMFEAAGGRVVVCEEGHLPPVRGEKFFSLCLHDHQSGPWHDGGPARWASVGIDIQPWREPGERILVRQQRGIGSARMASPQGWEHLAARKLKALTKRPVEIRRHPKVMQVPALEEALEDCWCFVTWASSEGTRALLAGVPVIWCAPDGFGAAASGRRLEDITDPPRPDRLPVFERMAWAQWRLSEIASGTPFRSLLSVG